MIRSHDLLRELLAHSGAMAGKTRVAPALAGCTPITDVTVVILVRDLESAHLTRRFHPEMNHDL
jgi:hypothetical protein